MYVPFSSLPSESRIWIYQSNRRITNDQKTIIERELQLFTNEWAAHGVPLASSYEIKHDHFIILGVNETHHAPSGCSIDASVHVMKQICAVLNTDLFDRSTVAFFKNGIVDLRSLSDLKAAYDGGLWDNETLVFSNVIDRKEQLESGWLIPARNSWLKRYLPKQNVNV